MVYEKQKSIFLQLDLHKNQFDGKLIGIIENKKSHANFILSHIIDYNLKNNTAVCIVGLYNPLSHYQLAGVKLGHKLKAAIDQGQAVFIDALYLTRESLNKVGPALMTQGNDLVDSLVEQIKSSLSNLLFQHNSVFLIVDDLSVLLALGVELKKVQAFLRCLRAIALQPSTQRCDGRCTLVVLTHAEPEDKEQTRLAAAVSHTAASLVQVMENKVLVI